LLAGSHRAARLQGQAERQAAGTSAGWNSRLEDSMADHHEVEYATAAGNDYDEHENSYRLFIWLVKLHLIVIPILLVLMWYFLV
jgi:hypothetical protein